MKLAVLGLGTVGQAVLELANECGYEIVAAADSDSAAVDPAGLDVDQVLSRKNYRDRAGPADAAAALDAEYDALVEASPTTLGDAEPAFSHVERALEADSHVVLANKGPVAQRYEDVRAAEAASDGQVRFEAAVGGAIPVLSTMDDRGGNVTAVRGVMNGTANFILSRMATGGLEYEQVLAEAQDLGVAETDPSFDVEGTDTALKCVILANVLRDETYTLADAEVKGIENVPVSALELATQDGRTIRLLGEVTVEGRIHVGPRLVPEHSPLAVHGTQNVVQLETVYSSRINLSGRGAGGTETADAVLADVRRLQRET